MLKKDLPLRYTWPLGRMRPQLHSAAAGQLLLKLRSIWEQIMANDKAAAYSDATHKAGPKMGF